jgi:hypothetical protein
MLFFLPSKRGFNFAKIRGFKVTDYNPLLKCRSESVPKNLHEDIDGLLAIFIAWPKPIAAVARQTAVPLAAT